MEKESSQDYFAVSARFTKHTKQAECITEKQQEADPTYWESETKYGLYGLRCVKPQRADATGANFICDLWYCLN